MPITERVPFHEMAICPAHGALVKLDLKYAKCVEARTMKYAGVICTHADAPECTGADTCAAVARVAETVKRRYARFGYTLG